MFPFLHRTLLAAFVALAVIVGPDRGLAMEPEVEAKLQPLLAELQRDGYGRIEAGWTWLGRLYVTAWRDGRQREIVIHPTSGEVLRDVLGPVPATMTADAASGSKAGDGGASSPSASVATATSVIEEDGNADDGAIRPTGVTLGTGDGPAPGGVSLPNLPAVVDATDGGTAVTGKNE